MTLALAIDTSTEELAVGIGTLTDDGVRLAGEMNLDVPRASLTHLVPTVSRLLAALELRPRDIGAVFVGRGPGSFTGVRIGVAAAKGIAQGLEAPLFGVGTLDAIAERLSDGEGLVGVLGDAMRREVYPALFRVAGGRVVRLTPHAVASPAKVAEDWSRLSEPLLLAGNGLRKYASVFAETLGDAARVAPESLWTPTGESLLAAAWRARAAGELGDGDPATVLPVYTRLSDAEEAERARDASASATPANGVAGPHEPEGAGA